jgi:hypothetical protein
MWATHVADDVDRAARAAARVKSTNVKTAAGARR